MSRVPFGDSWNSKCDLQEENTNAGDPEETDLKFVSAERISFLADDMGSKIIVAPDVIKTYKKFEQLIKHHTAL